jgi:hypothetical protein
MDGLPETHVLPIVGKLLSTIQADDIRFTPVLTGFHRLRPRKLGPSMLTSKNKVQERPHHSKPQDKPTHAALGGFIYQRGSRR